MNQAAAASAAAATTTTPSNRSNYSNSSNNDSISSFSLFSSFNSSISTKFSLRNSSNNNESSSNNISNSNNNNNSNSMAVVASRIQRSRRQQHQQTTDRLSVTLHTSESDLNTHRQRRPEFDRQKSMSRWMADTLSSKVGRIRRSLSSHETLISLSKRSKHKGDDDEVFDNNKQPRRNASFRLFKRGDSRRSMCKPVRKPSSGPDGTLKDVLMALGGGDSTHRSGSTTFFRPDDTESPDDLDIEMDSDSDTTDNEEDEFGGSTDFTSAELNAQQPPLLTGRMRWDASSPSRKEAEMMQDVSPTTQQGLTTRRSSKTMPTLPPPPFTPVKSPGSSSSSNNKLGRCKSEEMLAKSSFLAPLAAAAIAIATDVMEDEDIDDEEEELEILNDMMNDSIQIGGGAGFDESRNVIDESEHTDGAMASSVCTWNDSISTDGVSLLSASNASLPYWTLRSNSSIGGNLGNALERLNEEDQQQRGDENGGCGGGSGSRKDFSHKSATDDTCESAYTFHHDANDSPAPSFTTMPLKPGGGGGENLRALAPLLEPPLTPLRDASVVPPAMPRRSLSNHNDVGDVVPMASPADRLKCLINKNGRRSSMPNGAYGGGGSSADHHHHHHMNSSFGSVLRRASLDNCSTHSNTMLSRRRSSLDNCSTHSNSMQRRRASLDNSSHSNSASRRMMRRASLDSPTSTCDSRSGSFKSVPYPPSLDGPFDDDEDVLNLSPESLRLRMHGFLTPTVTKTVRASPAIGARRKRIGGGSGIGREQPSKTTPAA